MFMKLIEMPLPGGWRAEGESLRLLSGGDGNRGPLQVASRANPKLWWFGRGNNLELGNSVLHF